MTTHSGAVFDPTRVPHLSGLFAPVTAEVDEASLAVDGELPAELDGVYLRNGPNPRFTPIGSYLYPIDGDGMVHGVWLRDGTARYRNRFVRTPGVLAEERAGRALWGGLESMVLPGPAEAGPELANRLKDLPGINVVRHGSRLLALAESAPPFRLTPELDTLGPETFGGQLPAGITAHPKIDPVTGEMAVFCYAFEPPYLTWSVIDRGGAVRTGPTPVTGVDQPMMIHDMALTGRYLVLVVAPALFDPGAALRGGSMLSWQPERGTRVALIPRDGGPVRWASDEAFWLWHTVNAYDAGDDPGAAVILDYVQWSRLTVGQDGGPPAVSALVRAELDPVNGTMRRTVLDRNRVEFPRIDDRRIGRRHHRAAVGASTGRADLLPGEFDAIRWYDTSDGTSQEWHAGSLSVGEPVFAPVPGDLSDDHGYWLIFATDRTDATSWFLVIPAAAPAQGPMARVRIPVRVPLGLHGCWLPTEE